MGSEISALLIEPAIGVGAVALTIFAIVEQNKRKNDKDDKHDTHAKWLAIASIVVLALLIVINIAMTVLGG